MFLSLQPVFCRDSSPSASRLPPLFLFPSSMSQRGRGNASARRTRSAGPPVAIQAPVASASGNARGARAPLRGGAAGAPPAPRVPALARSLVFGWCCLLVRCLAPILAPIPALARTLRCWCCRRVAAALLRRRCLLGWRLLRGGIPLGWRSVFRHGLSALCRLLSGLLLRWLLWCRPGRRGSQRQPRRWRGARCRTVGHR